MSLPVARSTSLTLRLDRLLRLLQLLRFLADRIRQKRGPLAVVRKRQHRANLLGASARGPETGSNLAGVELVFLVAARGAHDDRGITLDRAVAIRQPLPIVGNRGRDRSSSSRGCRSAPSAAARPCRRAGRFRERCRGWRGVPSPRENAGREDVAAWPDHGLISVPAT